MINNIPELFGSMVFNDVVMRDRLPKETYKALRQSIERDDELSLEIANVVANVMKNWALEKGATHYTHWFQPMTGITAEKHDSFISPEQDGTAIMRFSGKELIKGEPDASSFPSGGMRSTFEARGYTAWDPSSYAFIKDGVLCIPSAFCSYHGQVLDKKTPLLRSKKALSENAVRLIKLFGSEASAVDVTVGAEQEYFLIDKDAYNKRSDIRFSGRTLFGARPPKGQELEDHYFGNIRPRILSYMDELDRELWKLGIAAKTRHNEAAPAQHELAPVFTSVNVATDHNQLTMEMMKKVAERHGFYCLLHEKPFAGVNGSGKHNNWSLCTDTGENLLSPGKRPQENLQFLTIVAAVIRAVDLHQDLLRLSVATAGNDHRLGANEAPPAIISMYLGEELFGIFEAIGADGKYNKKDRLSLNTGVHSIPAFKVDTADRNRTSPFAFTGNKFEFRMLGSSINIACPNILLNTMVADSLGYFAAKLEKSKDFETDLKKLIKDTYNKHKRIIFNGNNYSSEWVEEAEKRGLLNIKGTPDALANYDLPKNIELVGKHNVYTPEELKARKEILLENYCKIINIEALTMTDMFTREIFPAVSKYSAKLAKSIQKKADLGLSTVSEKKLLEKICALLDEAYIAGENLSNITAAAKDVEGLVPCAKNYYNLVLPAMQELRKACDSLELLTAKECWPFPTYQDILYP